MLRKQKAAAAEEAAEEHQVCSSRMLQSFPKLAEIIPIPRFCWIIQSCSIISIAAGVYEALCCIIVHFRKWKQRKQRTQKTDNRTQRHCGCNRHWTEVKNAIALVLTIREHLLVGLYQTCTFTHLFDTLVTGMGRGTCSGFGLEYNVGTTLELDHLWVNWKFWNCHNRGEGFHAVMARGLYVFYDLIRIPLPLDIISSDLTHILLQAHF